METKTNTDEGSVRVPEEEIDRLFSQKIEKDPVGNTLDDFDRRTFRIFSRIGKLIQKEFFD